jgi:hypothetical protein
MHLSPDIFRRARHDGLKSCASRKAHKVVFFYHLMASNTRREPAIVRYSVIQR